MGRRIYADGVFDLFHYGHVRLLERIAEIAREEDLEVLIGVVGDRAAQSYKRQPVLHLRERAEVVRACRHVDFVIEDPPLVLTEEFLDRHQIYRVVHGDDSAQEEFFAAAIQRGIMRYIPYTRGISTTEIIDRIRDGAES